PTGQQSPEPAAPPSGGAGRESASVSGTGRETVNAEPPPTATPAAPGAGGAPAVPPAGAGGGTTSGPGGSRPRSESDAGAGQDPGPQAAGPPSPAGDTPDARNVDTEPDADDDIEKRAANAVQETVSDIAGHAASTAIENRQDENEDGEHALADATVQVGAASASAPATAADDSTGFTKRFRR
ncbi:hypothetical protein ACFT2B_31220, partial [Micromonospora sp. NPDC057140]